jgi:hypothetical protein
MSEKATRGCARDGFSEKRMRPFRIEITSALSRGGCSSAASFHWKMTVGADGSESITKHFAKPCWIWKTPETVTGIDPSNLSADVSSLPKVVC